MPDPFKQIREMLSEVSEKVKKNVEKVLGKNYEKEQDRRNYIAEIRACGEEAEKLMNDQRYPKQQKFLKELKTGYIKILRIMAIKFNEDTKLDIARIGAKIELLDSLLNHSEDALQEVEVLKRSMERAERLGA